MRREIGIGASETPAIMGTENKRYSSALSVYCDKVGLLEESEEHEAATFGREVEPYLLQYFGAKLDWVRGPTGDNLGQNRRIARSTQHPHMFCTPDAFIRLRSHPAEEIEVNLKVTTRGEWDGEDVPAYVYDQAQHSMVVLGTQLTVIAGIVAMRGGIVPRAKLVPQDLVRQAQIIEATAELWDRVQRRDPPEADGGDASARALHALYPVDNDTTVSLGDDMLEITRRLDLLDQREKDVKDERAALRQAIQRVMGEAKFGVLPDRRVWSLGTVNKASYVVKATSYRNLTRVAEKRAGAIANAFARLQEDHGD